MSNAESNRSARRAVKRSGENKKPGHIGESVSKGRRVVGSEIAKERKKAAEEEGRREGGNALEREMELFEGTRHKRIEQS